MKRVNGKDRKQKIEWTEDRRWDGLIKKKVGRTEYRKRGGLTIQNRKERIQKEGKNEHRKREVQKIRNWKDRK